MAKRYYWLKLKDDFFNKKEIKRLRRMAGGDTYTIIYLKMLLLGLKSEGYLYFDDIGDDFVDELSLELDEDLDDTKMTLHYLESKGLLEIVSDSEYHLNQLPGMVGSETDKAAMMRKKRAENKEIENKNGNNVTQPLPNRYTEKETEKEIDIEKDIEQQPTAEIVQFWDNNGFGYNNINGKQELLLWLDDSSFKQPKGIIIKAMKIACNNSKRTLNYVQGILKNWHNESLLTLEEVESEQKKSSKPKTPGDSYNPAVDRF